MGETHPVPEQAGAAVLIRAARNEAEAAQVVLRPARDLKPVEAQVTALVGPGGAEIPADRVDLLRVR